MKLGLRLPIVTLFVAILSAAAFGQAKIEGFVSDEKSRHPPVSIVVTPGGQEGRTDSHGHFLISLPNNIQPGVAARIVVKKPGWVIYHPMLGHCATQSSERNYEPLRVVIVPKSSPLALSPKRLSQVIAQWTVERAKLRSEAGKLQQSLGEYAFLKKYATEYGFTLEQFRDAARQWAQIKESDNSEERALKEYWQGNYDRAAQLAQESAKTAAEELRQANQKTAEASSKVIGRYKLTGNAYYAQYKFKEAVEAYDEIGKLFDTMSLSKEAFIADWIEVKQLVGNAKRELGIRIEGAEGSRLLNEALSEYRQTEIFYTRKQSPQDWATTQNNVGVVLRSLGERASRAESIKYLKDALSAYHAALEVRTREQLPEDWAATQTNLGNVLSDLGVRAEGTESIEYLNDAVAAYSAALQVNTRQQLPQDWAVTQLNLGIALTSLGARTSGTERVKHLNDAHAAHRAALEVLTREQLPQQWAMTQNSLGNLLSELGAMGNGTESIKYLNDAVAAYRAALEARTRKQLPQQWAITQNNLCDVLSNLGERVGGAEGLQNLRDAVAACRGALEVFTGEQFPQRWVITQGNLARIYFQLHDWSGSAETFLRILTIDPNNKEAHFRATFIYHKFLFNFDKAFVLDQQWLAQHPEDISTQVDFAEAHFTAGRFAECGQRILALLAMAEVPVSVKTALRAIEIASLLADIKASEVPSKLDAMIAEVTRQPPAFQVRWFSAGTRHFVDKTETLSPYRAWLGKLFEALASKDRDSMLKNLQDLRASFNRP